jgi:multisubunit Na+/H+ antiporter MnhB subunit
MMGLKGKARKWFGWLTIIFSDLAFGASTVFALKRLFVSESAQQPMVDVLDLLIEGGLGIVLVTLAAFMIWRLVDLFQKDGRWSKELSETEL